MINLFAGSEEKTNATILVDLLSRQTNVLDRAVARRRTQFEFPALSPDLSGRSQFIFLTLARHIRETRRDFTGRSSTAIVEPNSMMQPDTVVVKN